MFLAKVLPNLWQRHLEKTLLLPALVSNAPVSACYQITYLYYLHSGARIIRTKIRENFVRIKQNVRIIHTKKSVGKHTVVWITIVRIKQNMRIIRALLYYSFLVCQNVKWTKVIFVSSEFVRINLSTVSFKIWIVKNQFIFINCFY